MKLYPIKEEVYMVYTEGDPKIAEHEQGMEDRMPSAQDIHNRFPATNMHDLSIARQIWRTFRNPRIVTNDASHPNNWNAFQLVKLAELL